MTDSQVVLADGTFDPLHVGHLRYLAFAAAQGRGLAVRVADDEAIHAKGRTPFQTQAERWELLSGLRLVNRVILGDGDDLDLVIRALKPIVFVKGAEWQNRLSVNVLD